MRTFARAVGIRGLVAVAVGLVIASASRLEAQVTTRLSVSTAGGQGNGSSVLPSISADGRFIAFQSGANGLVAGDNNGFVDVFVRDVSGQTTERVSVGLGGAESNGDSLTSRDGSISGSGRVVVFASTATNLAPGAVSGRSEIYARDLQFATTQWLSQDLGGPPSDGPSRAPAISADGRFVAFESGATNLIVGDTNGVDDVFVLDCRTGDIERVSLDSSGQQVTGRSFGACISEDGRYVAFASDSSGLVAGDTNASTDVFLRDRLVLLTTRMSVDSAGSEGNFPSSTPSISDDGRHVAFQSFAMNLVGWNTNMSTDVFVHDCTTGLTSRVSRSTGGAQANGESRSPSISGNGRFVAFETLADDMVAGDTNSARDVVVHDRRAGTTQRVSLNTAGVQGDATCGSASLSQDGRIVVFQGMATNLVAGDTNVTSDIFAFGAESTPILPLCFGDGSGAMCPCGNVSELGSREGCLNSLGRGGRLSGTGVASVLVDSVVLRVSGVSSPTAQYFQGTNSVAGGLGVAFGDGLRCAGGALMRIGVGTTTNGASDYPLEGQTAISVRGQCSPGSSCTYQVWYRDTANFCTSDSFNATNALLLTWSP